VQIEVPEDFSAGCFFATEARCYLTEYKAGGYFTFDKNGTLLKKNIAKGMGPREFLFPTWIDYANNQLLISDMGREAVHLIRLDEDQVLAHDIINLGCTPQCLCWVEGLFVVVGFWHDGQRAWWARGFSPSDRTQKPIPLITQEMVLEMSDEQSRSRARNEIQALSGNDMITYGGGRIFGCWGGRLRIISATLQGKEMAVFGDPGKYYEPPKASRQMIDAYERGDYKKLEGLAKKKCIIQGMAATKRYLYITFSTSRESGRAPGVVLQVYLHGGELLGETMISDLISKRGAEEMYQPIALENKEDHELYLSQYSEDEDGERAIYVHRIRLK